MIQLDPLHEKRDTHVQGEEEGKKEFLETSICFDNALIIPPDKIHLSAPSNPSKWSDSYQMIQI